MEKENKLNIKRCTGNSIICEIEIYGQKLEWEFYTYEYILRDITNTNNFKEMKLVYEVTVDEKLSKKKKGKNLEKIYMNGPKYFSYIKFFEYENKKYGIVGGKTNYPSPDFSFDKNVKTRNYARMFLYNYRLNWSNDIIIVNHSDNNSANKDKDEEQAYVLECYLQRKYNLFDS